MASSRVLLLLLIHNLATSVAGHTYHQIQYKKVRGKRRIKFRLNSQPRFPDFQECAWWWKDEGGQGWRHSIVNSSKVQIGCVVSIPKSIAHFPNLRLQCFVQIANAKYAFYHTKAMNRIPGLNTDIQDIVNATITKLKRPDLPQLIPILTNEGSESDGISPSDADTKSESTPISTGELYTFTPKAERNITFLQSLTPPLAHQKFDFNASNDSDASLISVRNTHNISNKTKAKEETQTHSDQPSDFNDSNFARNMLILGIVVVSITVIVISMLVLVRCCKTANENRGKLRSMSESGKKETPKARNKSTAKEGEPHDDIFSIDAFPTRSVTTIGGI